MDYAENGTGPVETYMVSGPDAALASWSLAGDDAGDFTISSGGMLTFRSSPDFETKTTYMITVKADDGTYTDTHDVTIRVTDVDEAPRMILGPRNVAYAENGTGPVETYTLSGANAASATWSLDGPNADDFRISGGVLTFRSPPDFETKTTYMVTIEADDGTEMDSLDVTVTVTDVDEAPLEISGMSQPMYAENGTGPVATYTAMDPEEATITWSLAGDDAGVFDISTDGVLTFKAPPDYEMRADADTDNTYMVTVEASDGTNMAITLAVTIMVTDVDEAPLEISGMSQPMYAENGTGPVATYTAMDPEEATITWSLAGDDAGVFDISTDGVLTFKAPPDYEMRADADTDNTYMVTVEASDGTNMATTLAVTITVTDVDETVVEQTLLDRYDADGNDQIDTAELREAITHYILGDIDLDDVREIIRLYILG